MIVTRAHSVNKIGSDLLNLGFFCSLFLKVTSRRTYVLPPFWKTSHSQVHKLTRQSSATILGSQSLGGVHKHFDTNAQMVEIYTRISSLFLARLHRILPPEDTRESRKMVSAATGFSGNFPSGGRGARRDLFPNLTFSFGRLAECDYPAAPASPSTTRVGGSRRLRPESPAGPEITGHRQGARDRQELSSKGNFS